MRNKHIIMYSLTLLISNTHAMERRDWQEMPEQPSPQHPRTRRPSSPTRRPATSPAPAAPDAQATGPASEAGLIPFAPITEPATAAAINAQNKEQYSSIQLISKQQAPGKANFFYIINGNAIEFSTFLRGKVSFEKQRQQVDSASQLAPIEIDYARNQIAFIAAILNFLPNALKERLTTQHIAEQIMQFASQNEISFAESIELIEFFDIPIAFDALISIRQPMPLPVNQAEEIDYNSQLAAVFEKAKNYNDNRLWQLFGSMLYPYCDKYPEIAEMIRFITTQKDIEQLALGTYTQQHPQLYQHVIHTFNNLTDPLLSPDGQIIVAHQYTLNGTNLLLINALTGGVIQTFNNAQSPYFSPDGQIIVVSQRDILVLINAVTGTVIHTINNAQYPHFSPNGQIIAAEKGDNLLLINTVTGVIMQTINNTKFLHFSPDGQIIIAHQRDNLVLINAATGTVIHTINNAQYPVFSPNGQIIAAEKGDNLVLINTATGTVIHTINNAQYPHFSPDGQIIVANQGDNIVLINASIGTVIHTINNAQYPHFSPDGQIIAVNQEGNIVLINSVTGTVIHTINNAQYPEFSPNGQIITANQGNNLLLINAVTGTVIRTIKNTKYPRFSPDRQIIAANQEDNIVLINNVTGTIIHTINNANHPAEFSPDGRFIITYLNTIDRNAIEQGPIFFIQIRGYLSLREALQSPIAITSDAVAPEGDGSSAAPAAPHRSVTEPDGEEEAAILADPRYDQMGGRIILGQEQQPVDTSSTARGTAATPAVLPPAPRPAAAPAEQAPRRGILGTISNWWRSKKQ